MRDFSQPYLDLIMSGNLSGCNLIETIDHIKARMSMSTSLETQFRYMYRPINTKKIQNINLTSPVSWPRYNVLQL